ncbi:MAG: gluconate 2-dehydrogenase subunit 3 family protein [Ktedonobacteraceae bacterium]
MKLLKRKNPIDVPYAPPGTTQRVDEDRLPLDPTTKQPLAPTAQPGYYPGFEALSQQSFWDEATRKVVLDRVEHVPPIRFFTDEEAELVQAVCDRILPQDDRDAAHKIPIVPTIDERLHTGRIDGYRYEDMPTDRDAHRLGLQGIQAIAQHMFGAAFTQLDPLQQDQVLQTIHDDNAPAGEDIWKKLPVRRYWMLLVQDAIEAYYAHPFAWDEIGFGGPAYPRGYMRLEGGKPEPWEVHEQRYEWEAPPTSLSDIYKPIGGPGGHKSQPSGQEGTH